MDSVVTWRIEYEGVDRPLVIIDGRELSWDEFGKLVLTHEGWNFRLQFVDPSET